MFGKEYIQHYNDDGTLAGYSEEETGIFGDKYVKHYNQDGSVSGYSEPKTGIFGAKYTRNSDKNDKNTGYSERKTGIFGSEYVNHHDVEGSNTGYSERKTGMFGAPYTSHEGLQQPYAEFSDDIYLPPPLETYSSQAPAPQPLASPPPVSYNSSSDYVLYQPEPPSGAELTVALARYKEETILYGVLGTFIGGAIGGLLGWLPAGVICLVWAVISLFTPWSLTVAGERVLFPTLWIIIGVAATAIGLCGGVSLTKDPRKPEAKIVKWDYSNKRPVA